MYIIILYPIVGPMKYIIICMYVKDLDLRSLFYFFFGHETESTIVIVLLIVFSCYYIF